MTKRFCDICGDIIEDNFPYQLEFCPNGGSRYSSRRTVYYTDVCDYCANDLFNYIDTMRKSTRVKL